MVLPKCVYMILSDSQLRKRGVMFKTSVKQNSTVNIDEYSAAYHFMGITKFCNFWLQYFWCEIKPPRGWEVFISLLEQSFLALLSCKKVWWAFFVFFSIWLAQEVSEETKKFSCSSFPESFLKSCLWAQFITRLITFPTREVWINFFSPLPKGGTSLSELDKDTNIGD